MKICCIKSTHPRFSSPLSLGEYLLGFSDTAKAEKFIEGWVLPQVRHQFSVTDMPEEYLNPESKIYQTCQVLLDISAENYVQVDISEARIFKLQDLINSDPESILKDTNKISEAEWYAGSDPRRHVKQIVIKLPESSRTNPSVPSIIYPKFLDPRPEFTWAGAILQVDNKKGKRPVIFIKAQHVINDLGNCPANLAFGFYKYPTGGVLQIFVYVKSPEIEKKTPFVVEISFYETLSANQTVGILKDLIKRDRIEICFVENRGSIGGSIGKFGLEAKLPPECNEALIEEFSSLLHYNNSLPKHKINHQASLLQFCEENPLSISPIIPENFNTSKSSNQESEEVELDIFDQIPNQGESMEKRILPREESNKPKKKLKLSYTPESENFANCMIGTLIIGGLLSVSVLAATSSVERTLIAFVYYMFVSPILYWFLYLSRKWLRENSGIFIIGTIVVTGGGWWLGHGLAWLNVKLTHYTYKLSKQVVNRFGNGL